MTNKQFCAVYNDALSSTDRDAFASDWALSSIWGEDVDLVETASACAHIWDLAHLTIRDIRDHAGMTQQEFAERFCISRRTIEQWESTRGNPAPYIILMLAELCGLK